MDYHSPLPFEIEGTEPIFSTDAKQLRSQLALYSTEDIQHLQKVSSRLAEQVVAMNTCPAPPKKPALWAYKGDVYKGFVAHSMTQEAARWAQEHIRIPSGLYGLLRPYDLIEPYRLEMSTKLAHGEKCDLYEFWGARLARTIIDREVVVLASQEYARAVLRHLHPDTRVLDVSFIDRRGEREVKVPIYNKMMRGVAARWLADRQAEQPREIEQFSAHGYSYSSLRSSPAHAVFYREKMRPLELPS